MTPARAKALLRAAAESDFNLRDSKHAEERKFERLITTSELERLLPVAAILSYLWDASHRNWRFEICGKLRSGRCLFAVVGISEDAKTVTLITAYPISPKKLESHLGKAIK